MLRKLLRNPLNSFLLAFRFFIGFFFACARYANWLQFCKQRFVYFIFSNFSASLSLSPSSLLVVAYIGFIFAATNTRKHISPSVYLAASMGQPLFFPFIGASIARDAEIQINHSYFFRRSLVSSFGSTMFGVATSTWAPFIIFGPFFTCFPRVKPNKLCQTNLRNSIA